MISPRIHYACRTPRQPYLDQPRTGQFPRRTGQFPRRTGQALVEFSIIALVMYLLVGGVLTFGLWIYAAGQIQQAANVGARELSQTPLPLNLSFEAALDDPVVRRRIYDDRWLVIDLDALEEENPNYNFFTDVVPRMPLLNQQLATLYISDQLTQGPSLEGADSRRLLRYPGALLRRAEEFSDPPIDEPFVAQEFVVQIPIVVEREERSDGGGGGERIRWVEVVEEIDTEDLAEDDSGENPDPFSLLNGGTGLEADPSPPAGVVALRVHYPAQSAWLSSYRDRGPFVPNAGDPNSADDGSVQQLNPDARTGAVLPDRSLVFDNGLSGRVYAGTYGGQFGLGIHGAMTSPRLTGPAEGIRPYRRVLVSHAIFRREAFLPATDSDPTP